MASGVTAASDISQVRRRLMIIACHPEKSLLASASCWLAPHAATSIAPSERRSPDKADPEGKPDYSRSGPARGINLALPLRQRQRQQKGRFRVGSRNRPDFPPLKRELTCRDANAASRRLFREHAVA